ncbi:hypothetical protein BaRGS_00014747, partial [Batillaria attramentaria]
QAVIELGNEPPSPQRAVTLTLRRIQSVTGWKALNCSHGGRWLSVENRGSLNPRSSLRGSRDRNGDIPRLLSPPYDVLNADWTSASSKDSALEQSLNSGATCNMACCFGKKTQKQAEVAPMNSQPNRMSNKVTANGFQPATAQIQATKVTSPAQEDTDKARNHEPAPVQAPAGFQMPSVAIERVPDGEGNLITLGKLFGVWTAPWPSLPEQIMRSQTFTFDDSDVLLLGYAKSGTHWLWEMLHMLLKGRAEHTRTPKERLMISFSTQEFFDTLPPPRVFNCHAPFVGLPPSIQTGRNKCKMVYLLRNPKDLAVSYYHHLKSATDFDYDGTFHVPGDSWFDYVLGWEQTLKNNPQLPVLTMYYEDVKEDPVSSLKRLAEFVGVSRPEQLYQDIARECSIKRMKQVEADLKEQFPANISKTGKNFIYRK